MKEEYDFSNAEQGKFYVPVEDIQLPIYLDKLKESKPQKESLAAAFDLLAQMPEDFMVNRQDDLPQERDEWL